MMGGIEISELMDSFLGDGNSGNDPRFEHDVGAHIQLAIDCHAGKKGDKFQIMSRRNGYPPPHFNCWFPLYFISSFQGSEWCGEVGQNQIESIGGK